MSKRRTIKAWSLGSHSRNVEGCIATFDRDGWRWSRQFGAEAGYVQAVADYADEQGAKVVSLSTPETIWRDLQGTRAELTPIVQRVTRVESQPEDIVRTPEVSMLGRIGRLDLLLDYRPNWDRRALRREAVQATRSAE